MKKKIEKVGLEIDISDLEKSLLDSLRSATKITKGFENEDCEMMTNVIIWSNAVDTTISRTGLKRKVFESFVTSFAVMIFDFDIKNAKKLAEKVADENFEAIKKIYESEDDSLIYSAAIVHIIFDEVEDE